MAIVLYGYGVNQTQSGPKLDPPEMQTAKDLKPDPQAAKDLKPKMVDAGEN